MASPGFHDAQALIAKVKILINAQLKSVLKKVGLPVSGVKAAMQERIIARKLHLGLGRLYPLFDAMERKKNNVLSAVHLSVN